MDDERNTVMSSLMNPPADEDWEAYMEFARQETEPQILRELLWPLIRLAPDEFLVSFVDLGGYELASQCDGVGSIPLHETIETGASVCVVKRLIEVYPEGVTVHDSEHQSPLDILCRRILMSEERQKYVQSSPQDDTMWEIARLMLTALSGQPSDELLLHAVVKAASNCPESLRSRAFRNFPEQLMIPDSNGNLPIHLCAGMVPEDEELDDLLELARRAPKSLMARNSSNQTPLQVAESSERTWMTGIRDLIAAKPDSLESLQLDLALYPLVLSKLEAPILFEVLLVKPTVFKFY